MSGRRPAAWHRATVIAVTAETATAKRIVFDVPTWPSNDAGSHLDVRLTAPDGYQASRSYSIASSGEGTSVTLAVDELPTGEVSPFLVHDLQAGDGLELHGPLGAYFVWKPPDAGEPVAPVQLIAGGSGVVPLFAMAAAHTVSGDASEFRMLYSVRSPENAFFREELARLAVGSLQLDWVYTREAPTGWPTPPGRVTREMVAASVIPAADHPRVYVCGPTVFVETVAAWLLELGHAAADVRTERFGGT